MTSLLQARRSTPILVYHSISLQPAGPFRAYTVSPARFREHLGYLAENNYRTLTISELAAQLPHGVLNNKTVAITFDDAFADFSSSALPALQAFGMTATLYVPTSFVGGRSTWLAREDEGRREVMSWTEIAAAAEYGIECGAHSHTHRELDRVSENELDDEVRGPKRILEERLSRRIDTFAYPFGFHNRRVRAAVAHAGYASACAVGNLTAIPSSDLFALPRLTVNNGTDVPRLQRLLSNRASRRERFVSETKRHVWHARRRWIPGA